MAAECAGHNGFHLFDDWHIFELVDESRNPVPAGKPGRLILTTLYNYTQPLIRYEMNDEIVLHDKPCACSWCSPTIRRIGGRSENFLWFEKPDGKKEFIHPIVMVEFMVPGLRKLQVVQRDRNRLTLKAVIEGDPEETRAAIRRRMQEISSQARSSTTRLNSISSWSIRSRMIPGLVSTDSYFLSNLDTPGAG